MIPHPLSFLLSLRYTITAETTRARPSSSTETPSKEIRTARAALTQASSSSPRLSTTSFMQRVTSTSSTAVARVNISPSNPSKEDSLRPMDKYRPAIADPNPPADLYLAPLPGALVSSMPSTSSSSSTYPTTTQQDNYRSAKLDGPRATIRAIPAPRIPDSSSSSSRDKNRIDKLPQHIFINTILHFFRPHEVFPHMQRVSKLWRASVQSANYHPQVFEVYCPQLSESEQEKEQAKVIAITSNLSLLGTKFNQARVINFFFNESKSVLLALLHVQAKLQIPTLQTLILRQDARSGRFEEDSWLFEVITTCSPRLQTLALHNFYINFDQVSTLHRFSTLTSLTVTNPRSCSTLFVSIRTILDIASRNQKLKNLNLSGVLLGYGVSWLPEIPYDSEYTPLDTLVSNLRTCCPTLRSLVVHPDHEFSESMIDTHPYPFPSLTYCSCAWNVSSEEVARLATFLSNSFPQLSGLNIVVKTRGYCSEEPACLTDLQAMRHNVGRLALENFHYTYLASFPELTHLSLEGKFSEDLLPNLTAYFPKLVAATLNTYNSRSIWLPDDLQRIAHPNLEDLTIIGPMKLDLHNDANPPLINRLDYKLLIHTLFSKSLQLRLVKLNRIHSIDCHLDGHFHVIDATKQADKSIDIQHSVCTDEGNHGPNWYKYINSYTCKLLGKDTSPKKPGNIKTTVS